MTFHIITIFPDSLKSYIETSILRKAQEQKKVKIIFYNLRDFVSPKNGDEKRRQVDDKPYGGGAGMILQAEPILKAVSRIKSKIKGQKSKVIVLSAKGKQFKQKIALNYSKNYKHIILIAGRYEGIAERVKIALKAEEISIGPYVLTDGELPAAVLISTITRLIPGVIRFESLEEESFFNKLTGQTDQQFLEYPHYTRPEIFSYKSKKYRVPKILLSGNHKKIAIWRSERAKRG